MGIMAMDIRKTGNPVSRVTRPDHKASSDGTGVPSYSDGTGVPSYKFTGTHINYYFICKRKLWLFTRGISMEHTSDTVLIGKLVDESSYERKDKGIDIDGNIVIDWLDEKTGLVHEVKKSDSMEEAHHWQVLFYLWYLKQKGLQIADGKLQDGLRGEIDYPTLKQKVEVVLTQEAEEKLHSIMINIEQVVRQEQTPERINKRFCKTCSYFELCWTNR